MGSKVMISRRRDHLVEVSPHTHAHQARPRDGACAVQASNQLLLHRAALSAFFFSLAALASATAALHAVVLAAAAFASRLRAYAVRCFTGRRRGCSCVLLPIPLDAHECAALLACTRAARELEEMVRGMAGAGMALAGVDAGTGAAAGPTEAAGVVKASDGHTAGCRAKSASKKRIPSVQVISDPSMSSS